jgi:NitT/TauT family transport system substrate-binding protein
VSPRLVRAQSGERIRIAGPLNEDMTPPYYAIKSGMFSRAGLEVELVGTSSGSAAVTAVIGGTYEIAKTSLLSVFAAHLRGIPIAIVAPQFESGVDKPYSVLQVPADAPYKNGADLNGKTAGVSSLNDLNTLATMAWVDKTGGDWKSVKFVEIPNSALEAALQQHRIDIAMMQPPYLDASLAAGTSKTVGDGFAAIAPRFLVGGYIARIDWADQHADVVRRFARVLAEASAYVNAHYRETQPLVVELTKLPAAAMEKLRRTVSSTTLDLATVQPLIDAAAKYGLLARGFSAREIVWGR